MWGTKKNERLVLNTHYKRIFFVLYIIQPKHKIHIPLQNPPPFHNLTDTSIHISAYAMYGFAILCCPDFRKTMAFAELYHALATPLATIKFAEQDGFASWAIEP